MTTEPKTQTVSFEIPADLDDDAKRNMIMVAGTREAAIAELGKLASAREKIQKEIAVRLGDLPERALELRQQHDTLLKLRNTMRKDCADVKPLRAPRNSKTDDGDSKSSETPES